MHHPTKVATQVPDNRAQLGCEAWKHQCHWVARYAEASIKVSCAKTSVPRNYHDDLTIHWELVIRVLAALAVESVTNL